MTALVVPKSKQTDKIRDFDEFMKAVQCGVCMKPFVEKDTAVHLKTKNMTPDLLCLGCVSRMRSNPFNRDPINKHTTTVNAQHVLDKIKAENPNHWQRLLWEDFEEKQDDSLQKIILAEEAKRRVIIKKEIEHRLAINVPWCLKLMVDDESTRDFNSPWFAALDKEQEDGNLMNDGFCNAVVQRWSENVESPQLNLPRHNDDFDIKNADFSSVEFGYFRGWIISFTERIGKNYPRVPDRDDLIVDMTGMKFNKEDERR